MSHTIDHIIRERKTAKILREPAQCMDLPSEAVVRVRQAVSEMIEIAGWAPFHKVANEKAHRQGGLSSPVPWRFYVLEKPVCCQVIRFIEQNADQNPESKWAKAAGSKIPKLLAGCSALVQVTWLPDPSDGDAPALTDPNIEHIAAASAAVQNLLLSAQARGWHNYWSSGGILRDDELFDFLGIPQNQMLLGSIFLTEPHQSHDSNQPGGLRDARGQVTDWCHWINLD